APADRVALVHGARVHHAVTIDTAVRTAHRAVPSRPGLHPAPVHSAGPQAPSGDSPETAAPARFIHSPGEPFCTTCGRLCTGPYHKILWWGGRDGPYVGFLSLTPVGERTRFLPRNHTVAISRGRRSSDGGSRRQ